jgi:hypothetical protein
MPNTSPHQELAGFLHLQGTNDSLRRPHLLHQRAEALRSRVQTNGLQYRAEIWGFNQERSSIGNESTAGAKMVKVIDDSGLVPASNEREINALL